VVTHPNEDHIGELDDVLAAFEVEKIIYSDRIHTTQTLEDFMTAANKEEGAKLIEDDNLVYEIKEDIKFYTYDPIDGEEDINNSSVCNILDVGDVKFLFTGDLEVDGEYALVNLLDGNFSDIEVMKAGHHGSNTSTNEKLLNATNPDVILISAGEGKRYGHPHHEVMEKASEIGAQIFRTDKSGDIVVTTNGKTYSINKLGFDYSPSQAEY
jgi:competence protein ComEC